MNIEKQVVCKDLSIELEKAGYKQEGFWVWVNLWQKGRFVERKNRWILTQKVGAYGRKYTVAPTVAEGFSVMPEEIVYAGFIYTFKVAKVGKMYRAYYDCMFMAVDKDLERAEDPPNRLGVQEDKNCSNAIHTVWLYLKKEGLL